MGTLGVIITRVGVMIQYVAVILYHTSIKFSTDNFLLGYFCTLFLKKEVIKDEKMYK